MPRSSAVSLDGFSRLSSLGSSASTPAPAPGLGAGPSTDDLFLRPPARAAAPAAGINGFLGGGGGGGGGAGEWPLPTAVEGGGSAAVVALAAGLRRRGSGSRRSTATGHIASAVPWPAGGEAGQGVPPSRASA